KQWVFLAATAVFLTLSTYPAFSAESNETDLNKQRVTPPGSTRASSPAKDDVIYHPRTGTFKTGEELQEDRDRKLNPDTYDKTPKPTDVPPPMPKTQ
ncbi:MAG TPA: hypothetical protein VN084_06680, partial [Methylophilaceae bacterium]|nr:hypothetical protein [Methylophilaceae bacterium]